MAGQLYRRLLALSAAAIAVRAAEAGSLVIAEVGAGETGGDSHLHIFIAFDLWRRLPVILKQRRSAHAVYGPHACVKSA